MDAVALAWANLIWYWARFDWGWLAEPVYSPDPTLAGTLVLFLSAFWLLVFFFFGMYRERFASSRFDELVTLGKVVTIGILVLFFLFFVNNLDPYSARLNLVVYWAAIILMVSTGRIIVRSVQKILILQGKGLHRALIVGWTDVVEPLYEEVARYPEAGLDIVGAIRLSRENQEVGPSEYEVKDLPRLIDELEIQDVLIALGPNDGEQLIEVLRLCDGKPVKLKLIPNFYSIIGGMARTEHMYGLPLIEVLPEPMQAWEQSLKRIFDTTISGLVLLIGLPLWVVVGLIVRMSSPGPAIYRQRRVGQHGKEFVMYKFRTMRADAEKLQGDLRALNEQDGRDARQHTPHMVTETLIRGMYGYWRGVMGV